MSKCEITLKEWRDAGFEQLDGCTEGHPNMPDGSFMRTDRITQRGGDWAQTLKYFIWIHPRDKYEGEPLNE